jgi:uncharacterized membrane protein SirB2
VEFADGVMVCLKVAAAVFLSRLMARDEDLRTVIFFLALIWIELIVLRIQGERRAAA